jgi:hypothetical protein
MDIDQPQLVTCEQLLLCLHNTAMLLLLRKHHTP